MHNEPPKYSTVNTSLQKGLGPFAEASESVLESQDYPAILLKVSCGGFLWFSLFTFETEKALKEETSRTLWNTIINVGGEKREKKEQDAGRALYTSERKPLMEHLESEGE